MIGSACSCISITACFHLFVLQFDPRLVLVVTLQQAVEHGVLLRDETDGFLEQFYDHFPHRLQKFVIALLLLDSQNFQVLLKLLFQLGVVMRTEIAASFPVPISQVSSALAGPFVVRSFVRFASSTEQRCKSSERLVQMMLIFVFVFIPNTTSSIPLGEEVVGDNLGSLVLLQHIKNHRGDFLKK